MRRRDTPGEIADPNVKPIQPAEGIGSLLIEIPLWKYGRIKFESTSQKASLALAAMCVLLVLMVVLSLVDALPGTHSAISSFADRIGQAFLITIGVLLGVEWKVSKD